jgi:hypothetical protein
MNDHNEKPIILVIVTFFLAMTLVYIAFFRTQQTTDILPTSMSWDVTVSWWNISELMSWLIAWASTGTLDLSWTLNERIDLSVLNNTGSWINTTGNIWVSWYQEWSLPIWKNKIQVNKNLKIWYGAVDVANMLWLSVKEAFVDTWSTYYAYLGTGTLDTLSATVRRLWWNVLAIETENDINKNLLRWDRILFVNIPKTTFVRQPTEQKLLVVMIVVIDNDKWLIEAKVDRYYASKLFMKSVFEQLYWKSL